MDTGTAPSLRERKKAATRQALYEAAVRIALERGPDRVTRDAVADAAGVSRRTFSNYFPTMEEALLYGDQSRMRLLLDILRARPSDEPAWSALTASALELLDQVGDRDPDWVARTKLIRQHPSLVVQQVAMYNSLETDLAEAVRARLPEDDGMRSRLIAVSYLAAFRVAIHTWLDRPGTSLRELVGQALAAIAQPFDPTPDG